jgi:hypothetical protein
MITIEHSPKACADIIGFDGSSARDLRDALLISLKYYQKKLSKYADIRDSGEASDRQTDKYFEYDEKVYEISCFIDELNIFCR